MFIDRPVGIDLGTTNSEIALLDPSERDILVYADRFGRRTVPSAVAWDAKSNAFLVGHAARARRGRTPPPVESIKRRMGQASKVEIGPHALSPEDVSAKILEELTARMHEHLVSNAPKEIEVRVARAVITVPAYFDAPQVEATRRAGELARLDVIGILQEPTAAAIYHTWKSRLGDGNFLVYDLGGGTFDVSILRCVAGEYQVLAIDGDNYLGGDDFDRRFAEHLRTDLAGRGYALDLDVRGDEEDRRRFGRLVHLAQEIKESLSTAEVVPIAKQDFMEDKRGEPVSFDAEIGRADYERIVGDLVETTIACSERALARSKEVASVGAEDVDHVVLVGGSTRMPIIVRRVTEAICAKSKSAGPLQDEVDTCVALGAAIHAAQIGGLRVGDAERNVTVLATTPLVTRSGKLKLGLQVETAPEGTTEIAVLAGTRALGQAKLEAIPSEVVRLEVELATEGENRVSLALRDAQSETLTELPFALYRGDVRPRASSLSQPSVIAKDISLEVVRAGRRDRRVLLARGTGLPAETTHRFFTADQSGAVVLRLLQDRLPIKTVLLEVPRDLVVGTAVDLTLRCNEAMKMEVRAEVAGRALWSQLEAPREERLDAEGAVEALIQEAEETARSLWGRDAYAFRREAELLMTSVREVIRTDPDKLHALCTRLRILIDEFRGGGTAGEMTPPMHRFEATLDELRRVVYRSAGMLLGMDRAAWETRIADIDTRARNAYDTNDAGAWRRAYNEAQALVETATQEEFASIRLDDPAYLTRRLANVVSFANRIERSLLDFVPSSAEEVRAMQVDERDRLLARLDEKVKKRLASLTVEGMTPADLRRQIEQVSSELSQIDDALERIPSLGLVTERGGGT